jgi:hypothetical protein
MGEFRRVKSEALLGRDLFSTTSIPTSLNWRAVQPTYRINRHTFLDCPSTSLVCRAIKTLRRESLDLKAQFFPRWIKRGKAGMRLAKASPFDYPCTWEWLGPGGLPGLQNLWRVALRAAVGSTPIHSRLICRCRAESTVVIADP